MIRNLWPLLVGLAIWAAAFLGLYSIQALGCVWVWPAFWHRTILVAIALGSVLALTGTLFWQLNGSSQSLRTIGVRLTAAAIAASVVTFMPTLFVSLCV